LQNRDLFKLKCNETTGHKTSDCKFKKELTMQKIFIPLGIATFLLLTGFGVYRVARGKASTAQDDESIISLTAADGNTAEIEAA